MNIEHPDKLADLFTLLKKHGVKHFELGSIKVDFAPDAVIIPPPPEPAPEEKCNCGCALYHHNNGLCLNGCGPEKCAPEKK